LFANIFKHPGGCATFVIHHLQFFKECTATGFTSKALPLNQYAYPFSVNRQVHEHLAFSTKLLQRRVLLPAVGTKKGGDIVSTVMQ
jgi:hypothetical protein